MFTTKKMLRTQVTEAQLEINNLCDKLNVLKEQKSEAEKAAELAQIRAETTQKKHSALRKNIIALMSILKNPAEERTIDVLGCIPDDEENLNGPCTLYTGFCQMGGCYIGEIKLSSKADAYIYTSLFLLLNGGPSSGVCSECQNDYRKMLGVDED